MREAQFVSVRTAGLPRPTHSAPHVHELFETLSRVGLHYVAFGPLYTTTGLPQGRAVTAEPSQAAELASTPCMVVWPSSIPSPGQGPTVEPPEVSVVPPCEHSSCPVTARKAASELSSCPVTAKKAAYELSSCPVTARKAASELSSCPCHG